MKIPVHYLDGTHHLYDANNLVIDHSKNNVGIGVGASPTARLHLAGSTTAAETAPLKFSTGTLMTTPEDGAIEYDGTNLYYTVDTTRYTFGLTSVGGGTEDWIPKFGASSSLLDSIMYEKSDKIGIDPSGTSIPVNALLYINYDMHEVTGTRYGNYISIDVTSDTADSPTAAYGQYVSADVTGSVASLTTLYGARFNADTSHASASVTTQYGTNTASVLTAGAMTNLYGALVLAHAVDYTSPLTRSTVILPRFKHSHASNTVTTAKVLAPEIQQTGTGVITNGIFYDIGTASSNSGTITTLYGFRDSGELESLGATTAWMIYSSSDIGSYLEGQLVVGTNTLPSSNHKIRASQDLAAGNVVISVENAATAATDVSASFTIITNTSGSSRTVAAFKGSFNSITDATRNSLVEIQNAQTDDAGTGANYQSSVQIDGDRVMFGPDKTPDDVSSGRAQLGVLRTYSGGTWADRYGLHITLTDNDGSSSGDIYGAQVHVESAPSSAVSIDSVIGGEFRARQTGSNSTIDLIHTGVIGQADTNSGTSTPDMKGVMGRVAYLSGATTTNKGIGVEAVIDDYVTGTKTSMAGFSSELNNRSTATWTTAAFFEIGTSGTNAGTITNLYGLYDNGVLDSYPGAGTEANPYFLYSSSDVPSYMEGPLNLGLTENLDSTSTPHTMLALKGQVSDKAGPHVQFFVDDAYATMQFLNWDHDNISIGFDAYYDGGWKGSDSSGSYRFYKSANKFALQWDDVAVGGAISWNDAWSIDEAGEILFTSPLSADWDAGNYEIRSSTFQSDVATGTAPFIVASTTLVTNLDADTVDGLHAADISGVSGTTGKIAKYDSASSIGDSIITESGTTIQVDGQYWPENTATLNTVLSTTGPNFGLDIDLDAGNVQFIRCISGTGTYPIDIVNGQTGGRYLLVFQNAATISGVTYSWPAGWIWPAGGNGPTSNGTTADEYFIVGIVISPDGTILATKCEDFS